MTGNSVEKCFIVLYIKLEVKLKKKLNAQRSIDFKTSYLLLSS